MIGFEDAQRAMLAACAPLSTERVALAAARDRVLARDAISQDDIVPYARSAMDGYALRARDVVAPGELPVRGAAFAEPGAPRALPPGEATAIATGAPLPLGADAVVPIEAVLVRGDRIVLAQPVAPGDHVFPPGDDARRGELLACAGTPLAVRSLGLLAAAGYGTCEVARRPRVAIVCGGEELVGIDERPAFGQIRNSNATTIGAFVEALGATVVANVRVRDERAAVRAALAEAARRADVVITTGGASVGERDFVKRALHDLGARFAFEAVAMRPGRPTGFASLGDSKVCVLAGNPAAVYVALVTLVGPALRALQGQTQPLPPRVFASLSGSLHGRAARTYVPFVRLRLAAPGFVAEPLDNQCSSLTRTAAEADGLAQVPPGEREYGPGETVAVDVYDWSRVAQPAFVPARSLAAVALVP